MGSPAPAAQTFNDNTENGTAATESTTTTTTAADQGESGQADDAVEGNEGLAAEDEKCGGDEEDAGEDKVESEGGTTD